jgi:radical SAM superfamily enzyme YgiQ (UPF0313 family)
MSLLIYPPFADPTQSYPALPLLKGYVQSHGFEIGISDFNLLALLDAMEQGGFGEIRGFYDEKRFFDAHAYARAQQALEALYRSLSRKSGCWIDNNRHIDPEGPWSIRKLARYFKKRKSPFHGFYENRLDALLDAHTDLVGINLTFTSQLPEAFYLAQMIRERWPHIFVVLGGALMGQIVTQVGDDRLRQILRMADGICCADGGPALVALLAALRSHGRPTEPLPNLIFTDRERLVKGTPQAMDLTTAPVPDFDGFPLERYLAPSPIVLLHLSHGCYWNRCSFCRYGLNQEQGNPYGEMAIPTALEQIESLQKKHRVSNIYLSVDVLRPAFALHLAQALVERGLHVKWSTDLRMEDVYSRDQTDLLYQSGLVSVAFGVESASGRLLQKMSKGISVGAIDRVNRLFFESGIATCWMMFHYHPTETLAEAEESVHFVLERRRQVALFIIGEFGLTPHSKIFLQPHRFGIRRILYHPEDDFGLYPFPEYETLAPSSSLNFTDRLDRAVAGLAAHFRLRPYPFAGAVSTHHSMLYFISFGPTAFQR